MELMPDAFWNLTFSEFCAMVSGYQRKQTKHTNELLYVAWHVAAFSRQDRLPGLKSLMQSVDSTTSPHKEQTTDEMLSMCRLLNAAFGGEVVEA